MKVRGLFEAREVAQYPTPDEIQAQEIGNAREAYPQHGDKYSDQTLLAFTARTLRKNLGERTDERDRYRRALDEANNALAKAGLQAIPAWPRVKS